jgi:ubiquinone/menaquinone biosynthesis C-methylase UbiE
VPPAWLDDLVRTPPAGGDGPAASAGRFEGLYGAVYDRVIQTDAIRRLAPLAYGDAGPLPDLDGFVREVAAGTLPAGDDRPVLLDVPSGGGTLLPRLARAGYAGRVIEADLGAAMLDRAGRMRARTWSLDVALLRADAQDLPLADATVDGAVSLNGLHVMPDPAAFVGELARVVRPGGRLWLITLVAGGGLRGDLVIAAGRLSGILPGAPPRRPALLELLRDAGFSRVTPLGGTALTGLTSVRT